MVFNAATSSRNRVAPLVGTRCHSKCHKVRRLNVATRSHSRQMRLNPACHGRNRCSIWTPIRHKCGGGGVMDELVARLVANVGLDRGAAEKAVAIILDFLRKEGPPDKAQALIDLLPGVEALLAQQSESGGGFPMSGILGAGTKMMSAGLSMGQVQGVTRETIAYAREKIGDDAVGEIVGAIPGLSQFV